MTVLALERRERFTLLSRQLESTERVLIAAARHFAHQTHFDPTAAAALKTAVRAYEDAERALQNFQKERP